MSLLCCCRTKRKFILEGSLPILFTGLPGTQCQLIDEFDGTARCICVDIVVVQGAGIEDVNGID